MEDLIGAVQKECVRVGTVDVCVFEVDLCRCCFACGLVCACVLIVFASLGPERPARRRERGPRSPDHREPPRERGGNPEPTTLLMENLAIA